MVHGKDMRSDNGSAAPLGDKEIPRYDPFLRSRDASRSLIRDASSIQYPLALDSSAQLVHIFSASRTANYHCPSCSTRFTPRLGRERAWHFAHLPGGVRCDPDLILHTTAKYLIVQTFDKKKAANEDYPLIYNCPEGHPREFSLTKWFDEAMLEYSLVESTRSDVAFLSEKAPAALEVVVTHDIEDSTLERYASALVPVFKVTPTWETIEDFGQAINCSEAFHVPSDRCALCREASLMERHLARVLPNEAESVEGLISAVERRADPKPIRLWIGDRRSDVMDPEIRMAVYANARLLTEVGFTQSVRKPYLFYFRTVRGPVFGDLGGARDVPIWEDTRVWLHEQLVGTSDFKRQMMSRLYARLESFGVRSRFSFYSSYYPPARTNGA